jgi:cell wall-associated NlpC family hydrolase
MNISPVVEAGQEYDSSNVGISGKVEEYIESNQSGDPISTLTDGIVTKADVEATFTDASVTDATYTDASVTDASQTDASPTDAELYPQFQDRAVATSENKVNIRKEPSADAEVIGVLERGGICLVDEIGPEWTKIESGTCVGYISNDFLAYGDDAGVWCENNGIARTAVVNTATLKVRESKDEDSECVTLLPEGEDYYVYSVGDEWTEVCVDDSLRGFVKSEYVDVTFNTTRAVSVEEQAEADRKAKEEADRAWLEYLAQQEAQQQQTAQPAADGTQQTTDGTQQTTDGTVPEAQPEVVTEAPTEAAPIAAPAGSSGVDLANYACQFVGNPYVWGGTSLTDGADCSGFVLSVYAQWGISLPHSAASQAGYGVEVNVSDVQPGDLLFYHGFGHIAIYIGGGQIVHASNSAPYPAGGIKISAYNYSTPIKAVRILGQ